MSVENHHRYICNRQRADYGGKRCQCLSGSCLDEYSVEQVLQALRPAALELSLSTALHLEQERSELDKLWQQRLERARFEADRAGRHYHLIVPDGPAVAQSAPSIQPCPQGPPLMKLSDHHWHLSPRKTSPLPVLASDPAD
jgi:hypothetical protein